MEETVSRYEIGDTITATFYTYDADGNLQNADTTPTFTLNTPSAASTLTPTNPSTGKYVVTYEPTVAGRHIVELDGLIDTIAEYGVQYVTVHDGLKEAQGGPFPYGLQSWESAVR